MSAIAVSTPASLARPAPAPAPVIPAAYRRSNRSLGDPTALACTVAREALEVALGAEGLHRLTRWITPTIRASLQRQQSLARRAGLRADSTVCVERVRLCRVSATAVEISVVAREGDRVHPIAMRVEAVQGRWLTTALDVG